MIGGVAQDCCYYADLGAHISELRLVRLFVLHLCGGGVLAYRSKDGDPKVYRNIANCIIDSEVSSSQRGDVQAR